MKIIPAIDIIDGKCVRLSQGDYDRKTEYHSDPVTVARSFEEAGIQHLHLVDLDGAKAKHIVNRKVLENICSQTNLQVDFGGGIKSEEDIKIALGAGANQITIGSLAAKQPDLFFRFLEKYGADKIILGADARKGKIAVDGWKESTDWDVEDFISAFAEKGVEYVICTDIAKDGMMAGPSLPLYQRIMQRNPDLKLIASGGVSSMEDIAACTSANMYGAIIGKAIYEGAIPLEKLAELC